jgi:hypothetical protein
MSTSAPRDRLFVLVPPFREGHLAPAYRRQLRALRERLEACDPSRLHVWESVLSPHLFSRSLDECASDLRACVDRWWDEWEPRGPGATVTFVSPGLAGLIARAAVVLAAGDDRRAPSAWAGRVERLVELGVPARGIGSPFFGRLFRAMTGIYRTMSFGLFHPRFARDSSYGSASLTALHLRWVELVTSARADRGAPRPFVFSVLGTLDRGNEDEDTSMFDAVDRPWARVVDVPGRKARDVVPDSGAADDDPRVFALRAALDDPLPDGGSTYGEEIRDVVFLIHGIRTSNDEWPRKLATALTLGRGDLRVRMPTYGYMSALEFVFPWRRRSHARWFQAIYAAERMAHPAARFHCVAHSNGTYILGRALARLPAMRFDRIVLAGSVLPPDHWGSVRPSQYQLILNERARDDVPVGLLCAGLRGVLQSDVGTAGVFGFDGEAGTIVERRYHVGGHGAALDDGNLPKIARFVREGTLDDGALAATSVPAGFQRLSRLMPLAALVLVGIFVALVVMAIASGGSTGWTVAAVTVTVLAAATLYYL